MPSAMDNERAEELMQYPNTKADIKLCEEHLIKLCKMAAAPSDFVDSYDWDVQFAVALQELEAYRTIGTPEQFAAWKKAIDYARAQAINLQERIKLKENTNYREEVMRILILEESQRAYIAVLNEAQAALEAQEGE